MSHKLEWEHTPYIHYFTVPAISRTDKTQSLELSFNIKEKNGNDLIVEIPGLLAPLWRSILNIFDYYNIY